MNEKLPENTVIERIVETQEESEEDEETIFKLFVNEELVSWAKTLLYGFLKEIHTVLREKRRGYGGRLLIHIEKNAKEHGVWTMKTAEIGLGNDEATGFFVNMGYELELIADGKNGFLQGTKEL